MNRFWVWFIMKFPIHRVIKSAAFLPEFKNKYIYFDKKLCFAYDIASDIGKCLYWNRKFEEEEIIFFKKLIEQKKLNVLIDIGANIGWDGIQWIKGGHLSKAFAFEPSKETRQILEYNKRINNLADIMEIIPMAVSNKEGQLSFFHCDDNAYSSLKDTNRKKVVDSYVVDVITLDLFMNDKVNLDDKYFIKIDVEGFENEVIDGAFEFIKNHKPELFIEIFQGENSNSNPDYIFTKLCSIGYKAYCFNNNSLLNVTEYRSTNYNYYFTSEPYV